jgi:DGQHR domain-containing protein
MEINEEANKPYEVFAIKVQQWLNEWENVIFDQKNHRTRPNKFFYMFTLSAPNLKALSGVYRRTMDNTQFRPEIQRRHDPERSKEINVFTQYGYPLSSLNKRQRESGQFDDLKKPGWLPTAIIVNILTENDTRRGKQVHVDDLISITDESGKSIIKLPKNSNQSEWKPQGLPPIEVIDGQHRLWAFDDQTLDGDFELPVVAFYGLDISWQAYLFWTINIKPKKINASLAFDLYPLLRMEDWLERGEGHAVYRESRSQELVDALWSYPDSPWYRRINMLGESGLEEKMVTQAAWIKSLTATYVRSWEGKGIRIGGLFGASVGSDDEVLPWSRAQQAAFLIFVWQKIENALKNSNEPWMLSLRTEASDNTSSSSQDPAFVGSHNTHFNTNIGTRGVLYITNDLCYVMAQKLRLSDWDVDGISNSPEHEAISMAIESLANQPVGKFLTDIANNLVTYDWRSFSAPGLSEDERLRKAAIRGGAGYKELRKQLLTHLSINQGDVGIAAKEVIQILGY